MYAIATLGTISPDMKTLGIVAMVAAGLLLMFGKPLFDKIKEAQAAQAVLNPVAAKPAVVRPGVPVTSDVDDVLSHVSALIRAGQSKQSQSMVDDATNFLKKYTAVPPVTASTITSSGGLQ